MIPDFYLKCLLWASLTFFCFENNNCQKAIINQNVEVLKPLNSDDTLLLANECLQRRLKLSKKLVNGIIIININDKTDDNFFYLTGWNCKPASCFINVGDNNFKLFIPGENPHSIIWNGKQAGTEEAKRMGANSINYFDFKKQLKLLLKSDKKLFLLKEDNVLKENLRGLLLTKADSDKIVYIDTFIHEMRVIKSNYEVQNIKKAIAVTANALTNAFSITRPNIYEYEISALFSFEYAKNGLKESFPSICGSGINSTALHYETNNKLMNSGEVLLMDVGAEYNGYAADITRTIPVNGRFNKNQLDLYNLVLNAQEEGIKVMKPGYTVKDFHLKCNEILIRGLYKLGFITDTAKTWQKEIFILYKSGHYLGLNVHDAGRYSRDLNFSTTDNRYLSPGMVLTIEPGIYINPQMLNFIYELFGNKVSKAEMDDYVTKVSHVFKKYANIGIRIEDDILITNTGNEILSSQVPKQVEEIERFMNKK